MTDFFNLSYRCSKCRTINNPYGTSSLAVPLEDEVECVKCHNRQRVEWLDDQTHRDMLMKKKGLQTNSNNDKLPLLEKKFETLEAKQNANEKEMELFREKLAILTKNEIKNLLDKAGDHEFNLNNLQGQIDGIRKLLEKVSNWQDKQDGR